MIPSGVLLGLSVGEFLSGVGKSKGNRIGWIFFVGITVEFLCAAAQAAALILTVRGPGYSKLEQIAALLTVIIDIILLLLEAMVVSVTLLQLNGNPPKGVIKSMFFACRMGFFLFSFAAPIYWAELVKGRDNKPFQDPRNSYLLIGIVMYPYATMFSVVLMRVAAKMMDKNFNFQSDSWKRVTKYVRRAFIAMYGTFALWLGIRILKARGQNLSISFLVISNLVPAVVTIVSVVVLNERQKG